MKHICRYCGKDHIEGTPLPLEDWAWRSITTLERRWLARMYRRPRCSICDAPLACGQTDSHYTCRRLVDALENT